MGLVDQRNIKLIPNNEWLGVGRKCELAHPFLPEILSPIGWGVKIHPIRVEPDQTADVQYQAFQRNA
jgi:hypothetical protein